MKKSKFILFLLLLVLAGCDHSTLNFPDEFVPGEVYVKFIESVKKPEAEALLEELNLNPIDLSALDNEEHPNWTLIEVPVGKEKIWVKRFNTYSIVEVAELNGIGYIGHTH